jgi:hypothetical protein
MDVNWARPIVATLLALVLSAPAVAHADTQELVGYGSGQYAFQAVAVGAAPGFADPGFPATGWGAGAAPFGFLTTCAGVPAPTQTGGWTNHGDLLLRRTFQAPAGVGAGSVEVRVDNDVDVYVNGTLLATRTHEGCAGASPPAPVSVPAGTLQAGANLLALRARDRADQRYIDARVVANVDRFAVSLSPATLPAGAQRTLTATIRNLGSATLQSVTLSPPAGLTGGGTLSGLGLAPGGVTTRSFDVVAACGASGGSWGATASAPGTAPALAAAESNLGTGVSGACSLRFATQPANARVGDVITDTAFTPGAGPVVVEVRDAAGDPAAGANAVAVARDPGSPGTGTLTGGGPREPTAGAATFAELRIDAAGAYRLNATSAGAAPATSTPFAIEQAAATCTGASCSASVESPVTAATVTAAPLGGGPAFVSISLNVGPAVDCAGYNEFSPDWVSVDGRNTGTKTLTYKISYRTLFAGWRLNGLALVQSCFSAPYTFATRNGVVTTSSFDGDGDGTPETWNTGLLRECRFLWVTSPPPCVKERRLLRDGIVIVSSIPGGTLDPKMRG